MSLPALARSVVERLLVPRDLFATERRMGMPLFDCIKSCHHTCVGEETLVNSASTEVVEPGREVPKLLAERRISLRSLVLDHRARSQLRLKGFLDAGPRLLDVEVVHVACVVVVKVVKVVVVLADGLF